MKGEEQEAHGDCKIDEVLSRLAYYLTFPRFFRTSSNVTFAGPGELLSRFFRATRLKHGEFSRRSR